MTDRLVPSLTRRILRVTCAIAALLLAPRVAAAADVEDSLWTRDTLTGDWGGLRTSLRTMGIQFGLQEQSEVWSNMSGGLRRGDTYVGLTNMNMALDLEKLAGWTGARFYVSAYQIHGRGPTANLVSNLQPVSNLEATRDTKLYQAFIEQTLFNGALVIRLGQEGANDQFMNSQYATLFLNSSFGFPPLAALTLPSGAPNYPLAAPFVRVQYQPTSQITLAGAVFSGDPAPPGAQPDPQLRDAGGTAFRLNDHMLAFAELWYRINQEDGATGLPGTYKLGAWYHSGHFADQFRDTAGLSLAAPASTGVPRDHTGDVAVYAIADQMIWRATGSGPRGIGAFAEIMAAPPAYNVSNLFLAAGLNWTGPFEARDSDVLGVAVSWLGISPDKRRLGDELAAQSGQGPGQGPGYANNETIIEATYLVQATPWLTLQPDLQLVLNPGAGLLRPAGAKALGTAVVGGFHVAVVF